MGPRLIIAVVVVGESHVRRRSESPDARPPERHPAALPPRRGDAFGVPCSGICAHAPHGEGHLDDGEGHPDIASLDSAALRSAGAMYGHSQNSGADLGRGVRTVRWVAQEADGCLSFPERSGKTQDEVLRSRGAAALSTNGDESP
jgi:hypothetical protein